MTRVNVNADRPVNERLEAFLVGMIAGFTGALVLVFLKTGQFGLEKLSEANVA